MFGVHDNEEDELFLYRPEYKTNHPQPYTPSEAAQYDKSDIKQTDEHIRDTEPHH